MQTRTEKIIEYLRSRQELIDNTEKGSIEINFAGEKTVPSLRIFDDIK